MDGKYAITTIYEPLSPRIFQKLFSLKNSAFLKSRQYNKSIFHIPPYFT